MKKILFILVVVSLLASCNSRNISDTNNSGTINTGEVVQSTTTNTRTTENNSEDSSVENTTNTNTTSSSNYDKDNVPTTGTNGALVQIFADFQCPACQRVNDVISPVLEELVQDGKITIEYRQYPLERIHANAMGDALAALCANEQEKYEGYKKELYKFEEEKKGATVSNEDRVELAKKLGLDTEKFSKCLEDKKYQNAVKADIELGKSLNVQGTPTIFLDGKILELGQFGSAGTIKSAQQELKQFLETYYTQKVAK